jgi:diguanylate cyclase (GGDEF)-like protein
MKTEGVHQQTIPVEGMLSRSKPDAGRSGSIPRGKSADILLPLVHAALDTLPFGIILLDNHGDVRLFSARAAGFFGLPDSTHAVGRPLLQLAAQSQVLDDGSLQTLAAIFNAGELAERREILLSLPKPDGSVRVLNLDLRRAAKLGWRLTLEDVTQARATHRFLLDHDTADPVTGLANKRHFLRALRERLDRQAEGTVAVLRLNLQVFGANRRELAGPTSDALLRLAARRIRACVREDDVVARFMGDEFAVMVPYATDETVVTQLINRLTQAMSHRFMNEGHGMKLAAHIGAASAPGDGDTAEALLANAELALSASRAEHNGGWRFFEPRLDEAGRQRRRLEQALRSALAGQEFVLHYQPEIDLRSRRVRVFEALIRWQTADGKLIPPGEFIPLAEEIGLISDIGAWVLHAACREAMTWPGDIAVAVNTSPLQIGSGKFADTVAKALADTGLPAHRLEIEITENLFLDSKPAVTTTLARLSDMGVHLVMDDFGTGYASLSQLARFRFNKIKIDRSLISAPDRIAHQGGAQHGAADHGAIVRAIAALGVSLNMPTTAEGVETVEELDLITEGGCTLVQGYYFSKPVPAEALPALLQKLDTTAELQDA